MALLTAFALLTTSGANAQTEAVYLLQGDTLVMDSAVCLPVSEYNDAIEREASARELARRADSLEQSLLETEVLADDAIAQRDRLAKQLVDCFKAKNTCETSPDLNFGKGKAWKGFLWGIGVTSAVYTTIVIFAR